MQHTEANGNLAVERYLLGEMSAPEAEEFEEHIFLCGECAEAVKAGSAFADNARAIFKDEAAVERTRTRVSWWQKFSFPVLAPTFAALVLLCVTGYQRLIVISALRDQLAQSTRAQALPGFALHSVSRDAAQEIDVPASAHYFSVYFDVALENSSAYLCEIRNASGGIVSSVPVAQVRPDGTLSLLLERSQFPAGSYTLVVRTGGAEGAEIGQYPFQIEYK